MSFDMGEISVIAELSRNMGISFDESEDMTRQEFREECDVNHILRQHGYVARPVQFGEVDYNQDLTSRMQARSVFQAWFDAAPADVREAYPDLGSFLAAFGAGAINTGSAGVEGTSNPDGLSASQPEAGALG
jgi:hypothetical protein